MRPNLHFPADLVTFAEEILNVLSRNRLKETLYLFYSNEQTKHPYLGSIDVHLFEKLFGFVSKPMQILIGFYSLEPKAMEK